MNQIIRLVFLALLAALLPAPLDAIHAAGIPAGAAADPAQTPPRINAAPGPEYADSTRGFQGIPSIERASNGRLWVAWYGGGSGEGAGNYVMLATSGDDGKTRTHLKLVIDPDGSGPVRAFDPGLWCDPQGRLWLFWAQSSQPGATPAWGFAIMTEHPDQENPTWSKPRLICEGVLLNKPIVLSSGEWRLPAAVWHTDGSSRVMGSADQGASFQRVGMANIEKKKRGCDEHMIVERKNGSLWMLVRWHDGVGQSVSPNRGKTWTEVAAASPAMQQTPARFHIRQLRSGNLLLIKHSPPEGAKKRSFLTAYLSTNDGKTWSGGLLLEEGHGTYPDAVESPEGIIYAVYDFGRTSEKQIRMAVFAEEDVLAKKDVSSKVRMQVVLNQATGERIKPSKQPK